MTPKQLIRTLVLAQIAIFVAAIVAGFPSVSSLPAPLASFVGQMQLGTPLLVLTAILVTTYFIANVCLYFFWRGARSLYLAYSIYGLLITPLFGPVVHSGMVELLVEGNDILNGIILAVIYFSPIAALFRRKETINKASDAAVGPLASSSTSWEAAMPCAAGVQVPPSFALAADPAVGEVRPHEGRTSPFCAECGAPSQGGKFCHECGASLATRN